jgi:sulfur transfer protein SufE
MTFHERQAEIIDTINMLPDWHSRYNHFIEIGQELPSMPEHLKRQANRILSCTSRTYIHIEESETGITLHGWSNSPIPAGFIALFKQLCDGITLSEIRSNVIDFHLKTGLFDNLSMTRKSGFLEILSKFNPITTSPKSQKSPNSQSPHCPPKSQKSQKSSKILN